MGSRRLNLIRQSRFLLILKYFFALLFLSQDMYITTRSNSASKYTQTEDEQWNKFLKHEEKKKLKKVDSQKEKVAIDVRHVSLLIN